jgi:hypothetical protein
MLIEGELPKGQIGTMVSIFAIGGTACWLIAWPWREHGTRLLRLFMRGWFFLLIVPAVLLTMAIWRRLGDYGVTPDRYGVALVAVWVAALVLYLAIRRNKADMRAILGAVGVLLVIGSIGPFGANGLTIASQFKRLITLLEENGVLKDGKLMPAGLLKSDVGSEGSSIIYALNDADGLDVLKPWFEGDAKSPFTDDRSNWSTAYALNERLGFTQGSASPDIVTFNANAAGVFEVPAGAEVLGPFQAIAAYEPDRPLNPMSAISDNDSVRFRLQDKIYTLPNKQLLEKAKARLASNAQLQEPAAVDIEPGIVMLIENLSGNLARSEPLGSLRFWIIQRPAP